jgi:antitoxin component of MazEF toxin-antitoxin module
MLRERAELWEWREEACVGERTQGGRGHGWGIRRQATGISGCEERFVILRTWRSRKKLGQASWVKTLTFSRGVVKFDGRVVDEYTLYVQSDNALGSKQMIKTLTKHGNSYALVIDKPILELLKFTPDSPLEIRTDGKVLTIARADANTREARIAQSLSKVNAKHGKALKRLAE